MKTSLHPKVKSIIYQPAQHHDCEDLWMMTRVGIYPGEDKIKIYWCSIENRFVAVAQEKNISRKKRKYKIGTKIIHYGFPCHQHIGTTDQLKYP